MKLKIEKNLKIINELIAYYNRFGIFNVHIDLSSDDHNSYFDISGKIDSFSEDEVNSLIETLNMPRQHEIEHYYWNLNGESEFDSELTLVGMMVDSSEVTYENGLLKISLIRSDH